MNKKNARFSLLFIFSTLLLSWIYIMISWAAKFFVHWIATLEKLAKQPQHMTFPKLLMTSFWIVLITSISCLIAKKIARYSRNTQQIKNPLSESK